MSLTLEELNTILLADDALDTEKDADGNYPKKLGDLLAKVNGVSDEKILTDLGPALDPPKDVASRSDVVVKEKRGKRARDGTVGPITPAKLAGTIVDDSKRPQLALARLIDEYIRVVIREEMGGGDPEDDPSATPT